MQREKRLAFYQVLALPDRGTNITDAKVFDLTFESEVEPYDILREAVQLNRSEVANLHQASFTNGSFAWTATDKTGGIYYIIQKTQAK